jgi:ribosomal protein S20
VASNDANGAQAELSQTHSLIDRAAKWGVLRRTRPPVISHA